MFLMVTFVSLEILLIYRTNKAVYYVIFYFKVIRLPGLNDFIPFQPVKFFLHLVRIELVFHPCFFVVSSVTSAVLSG